MTLRSYLIIMTAATLVCWGAWLFVLFSVNPESADLIWFILFYLSLGVSLVGSSALLGFVIRFVALKKELVFRSVKDAFRQSFLFALLIVVSFFLLSQNLFSWFNLTLLIICLSVLEYFLISYRKGT